MQPPVHFDGLAMWDSMGYAARIILVVLVAFAALLFYIVLDRFLAYRRIEGRQAPSRPLRLELHRYLHTLAAIKVTAPLVGLLGTLLGLINGLAGIALTGHLDQASLAAGIAEALLTTVLGLVIGIPAWWAHSFFASWSERLLARAE